MLHKNNMAEKQIGEVTNYFKQVKAAAIQLSAPLKAGDKIQIKGGERDIALTVKSMQIDCEPVEKAKKGDEVGLLVSEDVHKGYRVFKK